MRKRLTNNWKYKLSAFVFAFFLWFLVVNVEDPIVNQVYHGISVNVEHEEDIAIENKTYRIEENTQVVDVTVRAKRSVLNRITKDDIIAVADVREMRALREEAMLVPIQVTIPKYEYEYEEASTSPGNLILKLEKNISKSFPVTPAVIGTPSDGYIVAEIQALPESIPINGPESVISEIVKVVAEVDVTGLSKRTKLTTTAKLYDSDNEIIDPSLLGSNTGDLEVQVDTKIYPKKTVEVEIDESGIFPASGYSIMEIDYAPHVIEIAGEESVLKDVTAIEIPAYAFQGKRFSEKTEEKIDITPYLPEGIRLADENGNTVIITISVQKDGTRTYNLPVGSIAINNLDDQLKLSFLEQQDLEIHVVGREVDLDKMGAELEASIDLDLLSKEGEYSVPVDVTNLPVGCELEEDIKVKIKLEKKEM